MATGVGYPDDLLPLMEMRLHREPSPQYVFHQFVMENFDFTARPGETVRIEGPVWLDRVTNPLTDRKLASLTSKVSDNAVQNFSMNKQEVTLDEFLLKNALQIKEYDEKHSIHDIAEINGSVLAEDYHNWRDAFIRTRMENNTFRTYTAGSSIGGVTATDYYSTDFFVKVAAKLANRYVPMFPDGNYLAIIDPSTKSTLLQEQKFLDATTRGGYAAQQAPIYTGELGVYGGIRYITSNNMTTFTGGTCPTHTGSRAFVFGTSLFGMFPMGTAEGLINDDRTGLLRGFGAGPIVQLVGMPVEVRPWEITDYGRFSSIIWIEHSQYSVLDTNPSAAGGSRTVGTDSRFFEVTYGATKTI